MTERKIVAEYTAKIDGYLAGLTKMKTATADFGKSLTSSVSKSTADWDKISGASLTAGAALAAGLGVAGKAAIDWESAWAGVNKTVDGTPAQMAALEQGLRNMAKTLPATHQEIAAVAEAAGQLGVRQADILGFTRVMIDLGETTNLTADEAATSIAQIANVMGTSGDEVDNFAATLVALGNAGASTESEILALAQRLSGAGKVAGASEAGVLSLANAMASVGIQAELGGSAMSRAMISMNSAVKSGGDKLEAFAKVAGVSAQEFAAQWQRDPVTAVQMFVAGLDRINKGGGDAAAALKEVGLKGTENAQVFLRLAGASDMLTESIALGSQAWQDNTALAAEAAKRYETDAARIQVAWNQAKDALITFGGAVAPIITAGAEALGSFASAVSSLPEPIQSAGASLGIAAAGALLFGGGVLKAATSGYELYKSVQQLKADVPAMASSLDRAGKAAAIAAKSFAVLQTAALLSSTTGSNTLGVEKMTLALLDSQDAAATLNRILADGSKLGGIYDGAITDIGTALDAAFNPGVAQQIDNVGGSILNALGGRNSSDIARSKDAFKEVGDVLASLVQSGHADRAAAIFDQIATSAKASGHSVDEVKKLMPGYTEALAAAESQQKLAGDSAAGAVSGVDKLGGALDESAKAAQDAAKAYQEAQNAIEMMGGGVRAEQAALRSYRDALADAQKAMKDGNATMDERRAALDKVAEASLAVVTKQMDMGRGADEIHASMQQQREAFIEVATAMTGSADMAAQLADAMGLIPDELRPVVEAVGVVESTAQVLDLGMSIFNLEGKTVTVEEAGADKSNRRVLTLDGSIFGLDGKTVQVQEIGATASGERVVMLDGQIYKLQGKTVTINANTTQAMSALAGIQAKLQAIQSKSVTVTVSRVYSGGAWENVGQFASGGAVRGPGTATSDSITARLSNGEHVLTAREVDLAGGQAAIYRMRQQIRHGMLRFAEGGAVDFSTMRTAPAAAYATRASVTTTASATPLDPATIRAALDGATLRLGPVDSITREVTAQLVTAYSRSV